MPQADVAKRTPQQRDHDTRRVIELVAEGRSYLEISAIVGISPGQVSKDLRKARQRWTVANEEDLQRLRAEDLDTISHLLAEALKGWKRSTEQREKSKVTKKGASTESSIERTGQAGDPRFLEVAAKLLERRAKLLGYDQAQETDAASQAIAFMRAAADAYRARQAAPPAELPGDVLEAKPSDPLEADET